MDHETARTLIAPFYAALTEPGTKDVAALIRGATTEDWRSFGSDAEGKPREAFIAQVQGFGRAIPDLAWEVREVLSDGDRIVVRSEARGTPAGEFFGVPYGGRSFKIVAIDVHTVRGEKLASAIHVEDWASAIRQLSAR